MPDPIVQAAIADAKAAAQAELNLANDCADKLIDLAAGKVDNILSDAEKAAIATLIDFVPAQYRNMVNGFVATVTAVPIAQFQGVVDANVGKYVAIAKARVAAVLGVKAAAPASVRAEQL